MALFTVAAKKRRQSWRLESRLDKTFKAKPKKRESHKSYIHRSQNSWSSQMTVCHRSR